MTKLLPAPIRASKHSRSRLTVISLLFASTNRKALRRFTPNEVPTA